MAKDTVRFFDVTAHGRGLWRGIASAFVVVVSTLSVARLEAAYDWRKPAGAGNFSALIGPRYTSTLDWWSYEVAVGKRFDLDPSATVPDSRGWFRSLKPRWATALFWHVDVDEVPEFGDAPNVPSWLNGNSLRAPSEPLLPLLQLARAYVGTPPFGLAPMLQAPKPTLIPVLTREACPSWRMPKPVTFVGLGGDGDRFALFDCEGLTASDAIDRLSAIARLPGSPHPSVPLPMTPDSNPRFEGEWVDGVHLLHPRLLWLVQRIALAFPRKVVSVYSGYRRDRRPTSPHVRGRALDIAVTGVRKESLYAFCRTLPNAGCGFYPNQPFVHVDVRDASQGSVAWVDISEPGQPSQYTEIWPIPASGSAFPESE